MCVCVRVCVCEGGGHLSVNGALCLASCMPSQACRVSPPLRPSCFISHSLPILFSTTPEGHRPLTLSFHSLPSNSLCLCCKWRNITANPSCLWMTQGRGRVGAVCQKSVHLCSVPPSSNQPICPSWDCYKKRVYSREGRHFKVTFYGLDMVCHSTLISPKSPNNCSQWNWMHMFVQQYISNIKPYSANNGKITV